jgi:ferredoxin
MEVEGEEADFAKGIEYLSGFHIGIESIGQDINRDEEKCVHCGLCTSVCATQALDIDRGTMEVRFDYEKCVACELCVKVCPVRAMQVYFT